MANRQFHKQPNFTLLISICLFIIIGVLAITAASAPLALKSGKSPIHYLFNQLIKGIIPGLFLGIIAYFIPLNFYKKYSFLIFIFAFLLMFAVFIPGLSVNEGGATRWIDLKIFTFQPSELLKLATILYLAAILSSRRPVQKKLFPFIMVLILVAIALYCQSNLSTLVIIAGIACLIFFSADTPLRYNFAIWIAGILLIGAMIYFEPYRLERFLTFLNPSQDTLGAGYHINQSLIAIGSGGLLGQGLGSSAQKLNTLPEATSDSIFAIFAKETGFIGCFFLLAAFILFTITAFTIAKKSADSFNKLVAIGIGSWITIQALVNISAMTGLLPLSGTPLPFITAGGTHTIFELISCGILLKISTQIKED
ncbi:MAG TPA: putative peptidoglycan glycosyltransferase FtsW [Candidatus Pacearchaeota archaeon]|nr:putative peptidoglycan glycosyltransferase FtsW [Candidatus Pacearchaeota archaeon]HQG09381.1 putative peptidoglycan glycosyltransferase FtsW [Candidatus Pacearchaeota archaeon]HQH19984.1 putative peptidoglycan glycosyltransferase FtsW [Candidatus Pacearchaeota archaeon]HQK58568.1 putative peptidoglycan glycosyltransferase FtsW [Candidatus Pacearchaeota archaeon]